MANWPPRPTIGRLFFWSMAGVSLATVVILGVALIGRDYLSFRSEAAKLRETYVDAQRQIIKNEVDKVLSLVKYHHSQSEDRLKASVRMRTHEAVAIAQHLYNQYNGRLEPAQLRRVIWDALRPIRFNSGRGYFFATSMDGIELLFADHPEMEGRNLLSVRDSRGNYVIRDMIALVRKDGEGFYRYLWTKPYCAGDDYPKIAFIKYFAPLDCLIGTGEYVGDVEEDIKQELLAQIGKIRFGRDGYIFVVSYHGVTLMNGVQPNLIGKDMWEMADPYGVKVIQAERRAVENPQGEFITYHWEKPTTGRISPKVSFLCGYPAWEWMIGAGVYTDEVETEIAAIEQGTWRNAERKMLIMGWLLIVMLSGILGLSSLFSRHFSRRFSALTAFFQRMEKDDTPINAAELTWTELVMLGESANRMLATRRQAEAEKARLEAQLQQAMKMEAVGRLAGGVAHDFNNLLTGITVNVSLAQLDLAPGDPLAATLSEIDTAARRASDLTRQLLAFSRKQIIEPKVVDLNELIASLQRMLVRLIGEDVTLRTIPGQALGTVRIDPGQFEQIIVNLVVNARDAMPHGGELVIETAAVLLDEEYCRRHADAAPGRYVVLAVSDTGVGMTDAVKEHLFEPFFTTKPKGHGTGLGLAIIYGAVRQAGGFVQVYSEPGHGTTFKIYLPRLEEAEEGKGIDRVVEQMPGGNETVLVVEDEAIVRKLAIRLLERLGYRVLHAADGPEALALARGYGERLDLLLTDVVMPGMNGRQLAEQLMPLHPETKVLYTSGYTENIIAHHGVIEEGLNFIGKPYTPSDLARRIREVLG